MSGGVWVPINNYPGDQRYDDIPGTRTVSYWGEIGTDARGWSWTIVATSDSGDQWEVASGRVGDEASAKAVVEAWNEADAFEAEVVECSLCGVEYSDFGHVCDATVDRRGEPCYTDGMTTTTTDIMTTIDIMTTVALTRVSPAGAALPQYTTNEGAIGVSKDLDGTWRIGPLGADRPFVAGVASLEDAVDFILGARALMAPA